MPGIVGTPFVDVISHNTLCSEFECDDTQYSRSASAVKHPLSLRICFDELSRHHFGSLVRTSSESQFGVYFHHRLHWSVGQVSSVVHHTIVGDEDRFKSLVLPLFIPVAIFSLPCRVGHCHAVKGEILDHHCQFILVKGVLLDISLQSRVGILKRFVSHLASHCCENVARVLHERLVALYNEFCFVVFHIVLLFLDLR